MTYISNTFPTSIQSATDPIATDQVATFDHAGLETYQNDSIEALKTKVGVDGSAVTTSHDYKLGEVIGSDRAVGKTATQTLTNKTLTSPTITSKTSTGTDNGTETLVNKTLTSPTITTPTISSTEFTNAQHAHTAASSGGQLAEGALLLTDITTNDATAAKHGFLPKLSGNTSTFLRGDGTFSTVSNTQKFGGTGADGALTITSGTTNIDLLGAQIVTKNYTSISITGTGALTFTNPNASGTIIIFKSQGNVTLTSSATPNIDLRLLGSIHGVADTGSGRGGRGGGCLYVECAGALNYTATINASGENFTANTGGVAVGNNGGGGGGSVIILATTITANSGVSNVAVGTTGGGIGGSAGGAGSAANGTDALGIYGVLKGGTGGSNTNSTVSTVFGITPSISTLSSKYIPLFTGSGGGGGSRGTGSGSTAGTAGIGMGSAGAGVAISGLNTEFQ
jgi:hypothetical protein